MSSSNSAFFLTQNQLGKLAIVAGGSSGYGPPRTYTGNYHFARHFDMKTLSSLVTFGNLNGNSTPTRIDNFGNTKINITTSVHSTTNKYTTYSNLTDYVFYGNIIGMGPSDDETNTACNSIIGISASRNALGTVDLTTLSNTNGYGNNGPADRYGGFNFGSMSNKQYAFFTGGGSAISNIGKVSFNSLGTEQSFGNLIIGRRSHRSTSNGTLGLSGPGVYNDFYGYSTNSVEYVNLTNSSDTSNFANLDYTGNIAGAATSNRTRAFFSGGFITTSPTNGAVVGYLSDIQVVNYSTLTREVDWGNLANLGNHEHDSTSQAHGGL